MYLKLRKKTNFSDSRRNRIDKSLESWLCSVKSTKNGEINKVFFPSLAHSLFLSSSPTHLPLISKHPLFKGSLERRNQLAIKMSIWRNTLSEVFVSEVSTLVGKESPSSQNHSELAMAREGFETIYSPCREAKVYRFVWMTRSLATPLRFNNTIRVFTLEEENSVVEGKATISADTFLLQITFSRFPRFSEGFSTSFSLIHLFFFVLFDREHSCIMLPQLKVCQRFLQRNVNRCDFSKWWQMLGRAWKNMCQFASELSWAFFYRSNTPCTHNGIL